MSRKLLVLFAVLLAGCLDSSGPDATLLSAESVDGALELRNKTSSPVYYFAVDRDALAGIQWEVCTNPATCNFVPPNGTKRIAYSEIAAFAGGGQAVVYHWRLDPAGDGKFQPDVIRVIIVTLE